MIAIPNMDMPKNCYACSFNGGIFCDLIDNGTDAFIKDNPTEVATKVLPDCPLIEIDEQILETAIKLAKLNRTMAEVEAIQIPKGHGRLIDGDWAKYNLENYSDLPTKYLHMDLVREAIDNAPTILEAEE